MLKRAGGDLSELGRLLEEDLDALLADAEVHAALFDTPSGADDCARDDGENMKSIERDGNVEDDSEFIEEADSTKFKSLNEKTNPNFEKKNVIKIITNASLTTKESGGIWDILVAAKDIFSSLFYTDHMVDSMIDEVENREARKRDWKRRAAMVRPRVSAMKALEEGERRRMEMHALSTS
jgi:hypothetical protein